MEYLRIILLSGVLAVLISCATTAPPIEGHIASCPSVSHQCHDMGNAHEACEKIAPAGFYWEAKPVEKSGAVYRCPYELRRLVPLSSETESAAPGCKSDNECKGVRICVGAQCQDPDQPKSD